MDEEGITHFHGHAKLSADLTRTVLKRLKFDNDTMDQVSNLVYFHDYLAGRKVDKFVVRKAMNKAGEENFENLLLVSRADVLAQSDYLREEKLASLDTWKELYDQVVKDAQCVNLRTLAVKGKDLIDMGMKPGKEMGEVLQRLLDHVLEHPEDNEKEILLEKAREFVQN